MVSLVSSVFCRFIYNCTYLPLFFFRGSCNKVGSLKRISVLLISLSNVGVVDLEVCFPIFGTLHSAPRYFNFIDRSELSVGRVPHSMMLEMLEIFWNGYHLLLLWTLNPEPWTLNSEPWTRLLQQGRIIKTDFRAVNSPLKCWCCWFGGLLFHFGNLSLRAPILQLYR